jgi:hypothetical protein
MTTVAAPVVASALAPAVVTLRPSSRTNNGTSRW